MSVNTNSTTSLSYIFDGGTADFDIDKSDFDPPTAGIDFDKSDFDFPTTFNYGLGDSDDAANSTTSVSTPFLNVNNELCLSSCHQEDCPVQCRTELDREAIMLSSFVHANYNSKTHYNILEKIKGVTQKMTRWKQMEEKCKALHTTSTLQDEQDKNWNSSV